MKVKNLLFICTGNTCRSPLAEALLRDRMGDKIEVKSAGLHAFPGSPASSGTNRVLKGKGIEHVHQAQSVTKDLLGWADVVLTMTTGHKKLVCNQFNDQKDKIHTLKEYVGEDEFTSDITDPFGGSFDDYARTSEDIERCLDVLERKIETI
ncbi:low molecular weight protein arginine phosphatase [Bacillus sp. FJAT-45037]|uniref:low molecular weight protein arginine phosphatase n=1 Tax=Bacillus sp. FJAT-45037 TaxID=2011007 RepID=UPI0018E210A3|nr:low molecular weight protein arginine phosphatase [Bacillus sp. FJAT-45037]